MSNNELKKKLRIRGVIRFHIMYNDRIIVSARENLRAVIIECQTEYIAVMMVLH